jgi:hypothetical protein
MPCHAVPLPLSFPHHCCHQLSMVERHKTAVGDFLVAERAAVAAAAERLQEDIRVQVERMVGWGCAEPH